MTTSGHDTARCRARSPSRPTITATTTRLTIVMPLGPLDVFAWGAGVLGIVLGLAVVGAFALATGGAA